MRNTSEHRILDLVLLITKWRKVLLVTFIVGTLLSAIISFILPRWYRATASIISPQAQDVLSSSGIASSIMRDIAPGRVLQRAGKNLGAYNYLAILRSRRAMEMVIKRFNLVDVYKISDKSIEKTIRELRSNTTFEIQEEDYVKIEVYDKDAQRVADIANYFVDVLNHVSVDLATQEAKNNREFIERRLEKSKHELKIAEDSLQKYQELTGVIITPEQSASITAIAELYAMKAKKEVEIAIAKRTVGDDNVLLHQLRLEISELNKKLSEIPQIGIKSLRLYRDLSIQQKIVEFLVPLYEQAKIDEQKDTPVILVLDRAVKPEKPVKPSRRLVIFIGMVLSLFIGICIVALREYTLVLRETKPDFFMNLKSLKKNFLHAK